MEEQALEKLMSRIRALPPLPSGVGRLLALDPAGPSYYEEAREIILADTALAGQVLKIANSALYRGSSPVETLEDAMIRVGLKKVVGAVTLVHLSRSFRPAEGRMADIWIQNLLSAVLGSAVAERAPELGLQSELAYTQGLLHHVGRLVMVAAFPNAMEEIAEEDPHPLREAPDRERVLFGFTHGKAGRFLANHWKFPPRIGLVIAGHHEEAARRVSWPPKVNTMIDLINLCDGVAWATGRLGPDRHLMEVRLGEELGASPLDRCLERLELGTAAMVDCVEPALWRMTRLCRALGLRAPSCLRPLAAG